MFFKVPAHLEYKVSLWTMHELATTFWTMHVKSFRHVITGFDFLVKEHLLRRPISAVEIQAAQTAPPSPDDDIPDSERRYVNLMYQLRPSWEWKKSLLKQMELKTFTFNLNHFNCRDRCRRWAIIHFVCRELSILKKHWKTTHVIVNGTRDEAERRLVHADYGFASR